MRSYAVYILASRNRRLYIGVTNNLDRRVTQHRLGKFAFTARYRITRLVYCEFFHDVRDAIAAEKRLKGWTRKRKLDLVSSVNPTWDDLLPQ